MADQNPEADLKACVDAWRKKHGLREDDAVLLLMDLFRIHLHHWDALRRSLDPVPSETTPMNASLAHPAADGPSADGDGSPAVRRMVGLAAIGLAAGGGFMLGRGWP